MAYVAQKPCRFSGQRFKIGEIIPDGVIHPGAAENLLKMGLVAHENGAAPVADSPETGKITIVLPSGDEEMALEVTPEGLQHIFSVLTSKADDAEPIVNLMEDEDALILLHMTDNRKSVKAAAEARGKALSGGESEGEQ